jgi:hypothetical protein
MNYENKFYKYKIKYINLIKQKGGVFGKHDFALFNQSFYHEYYNQFSTHDTNKQDMQLYTPVTEVTKHDTDVYKQDIDVYKPVYELPTQDIDVTKQDTYAPTQDTSVTTQDTSVTTQDTYAHTPTQVIDVTTQDTYAPTQDTYAPTQYTSVTKQYAPTPTQVTDVYKSVTELPKQFINLAENIIYPNNQTTDNQKTQLQMQWRAPDQGQMQMQWQDPSQKHLQLQLQLQLPTQYKYDNIPSISIPNIPQKETSTINFEHKIYGPQISIYDINPGISTKIISIQVEITKIEQEIYDIKEYILIFKQNIDKIELKILFYKRKLLDTSLKQDDIDKYNKKIQKLQFDQQLLLHKIKEEYSNILFLKKKIKAMLEFNSELYEHKYDHEYEFDKISKQYKIIKMHEEYERRKKYNEKIKLIYDNFNKLQKCNKKKKKYYKQQLLSTSTDLSIYHDIIKELDIFYEQKYKLFITEIQLLLASEKEQRIKFDDEIQKYEDYIKQQYEKDISKYNEEMKKKYKEDYDLYKQQKCIDKKKYKDIKIYEQTCIDKKKYKDIKISIDDDTFNLKCINHYKKLYILYIGINNKINQDAFYQLITSYNILINLKITIYIKFIDNIDLFIIKKIINQCNEYDILIYINELFIELLIRSNIQHLNDFLSNYNRHSLKNVSIIYYINSYYDNNIQYLHDNNKFRAIINFSNIREFIETDLHYSIYYFCNGQVNTTCSLMTTYNKKYNIRLITEHLYKNQIWWYKFYIDTPFCIFKKYTEISGNGWLNSILNLLLLSDLKNILIELFKDIIESNIIINKINDFYYLDKSYFLKDYLFIIINLILLKKKETIIIKNDILLKIAYMIIFIDIKKHFKYYLDFLKIKDSFFTFYKASFINYYKKLIFLNKNVVSISDIESEQNENIIIDQINKINNTLNINNSGKIYYSDHGLMVILTILGFISNELKYDFLFNQNKDKHIIFTNNKFKILLRLKINTGVTYEDIYSYENNVYKLIGCFIYASWTHNITQIISYHKLIGLICDNEYYIYDSDNIIIYDKWNLHKFDNYKENFYKDPIYTTQTIKTIYIETLIYILMD